MCECLCSQCLKLLLNCSFLFLPEAPNVKWQIFHHLKCKGYSWSCFNKIITSKQFKIKTWYYHCMPIENNENQITTKKNLECKLCVRKFTQCFKISLRAKDTSWKRESVEYESKLRKQKLKSNTQQRGALKLIYPCIIYLSL